MTSIPPTIAAESALLRQNVTLSVIKQNAEQQQQMVQMLSETALSAPVSGPRGSNVNLLA